MNLSMILESKNIFLLVSSEKKLQVLNQAKYDQSLPLYYLLNQDKADIKIIKHF
jgi:6-phosphogluconolactonase/glucosamine-6-phosphate isomerase/deaminase